MEAQPPLHGPTVTVVLIPHGLQENGQQAFQVHLQSNIPQMPGSWQQIAHVLLQGYNVALKKQFEETQGQEPSRIVVPSLQMRGPLQ